MENKKIVEKDFNRDPITGEPGSHPIGTTIGAGAGAAAGAASGAMIGAAIGPGGAAVGAVAGAIVGGLGGGALGGEMAEYVDPTAEEAFWEENYKTRPYVQTGQSYDLYRPAYRYGYDSRSQYKDQTFADVEPKLESEWPKVRNTSSLEWPQARDAVRDAYDRTGSEYARRLSEFNTSDSGSAKGSMGGIKTSEFGKGTSAATNTGSVSNTNTPRDPRKTGNA